MRVSTHLNFCGGLMTKGAPWISKFGHPPFPRKFSLLWCISPLWIVSREFQETNKSKYIKCIQTSGGTEDISIWWESDPTCKMCLKSVGELTVGILDFDIFDFLRGIDLTANDLDFCSSIAFMIKLKYKLFFMYSNNWIYYLL